MILDTYVVYVKLTISQLRHIIKEAIAGSQPEENYSEELLDDPAFNKKSVYVPDDVKKKLRKWYRAMKLSSV